VRVDIVEEGKLRVRNPGGAGRNDHEHDGHNAP
jgi:hypothetical protein